MKNEVLPLYSNVGFCLKTLCESETLVLYLRATLLITHSVPDMYMHRIVVWTCAETTPCFCLCFQPKALGQTLLSEVFSRGNLTESDYFGLEFQNMQMNWVCTPT